MTGELRDDLQLTPHLLEEAADGADIRVGALLDLRDGARRDPKRLTDHLGDTDRALSDRFVPDKRSLASLVRFKGGTKQWKVEFDRDAVSSRAVIYDAEANTLTLTGLPDDLIAQLQSEGLGNG